MEAILDFTYNAISKIISGHTIMSGITEKSMADIKITNLLIFLGNYINLFFDLVQNGGHFDFFYVLRQHI